jgi:hypothetical protein
MSKIIIGIHGLGNKPPKKLLKKWWKKSIREGLKAIGRPRLFFGFELVYWADFLHPMPLNPKIKDKDDPLCLSEPYILCKGSIKKQPSRLRQKFLDYLEKQIDKIFLRNDLSLHFASVSDLIMRRFFKDLDAYYSHKYIDINGSDFLVKDLIRQQLAQVIQKHKNKNIVIIGHSMGSIIAYDVLTQTVPDVKINTFVTIGSPLGFPIIISKIASEQQKVLIEKAKLSTPENITKYWFNFSDLRDRVALNYNLHDDYKENANQVQAIDKIVYNCYEIDGRKNPHKIYGYLQTPEFAQVADEFLNYDKREFIRWSLDKINRLLGRLFSKL